MKLHYKLTLLFFLFASAFLLCALLFFSQQKSKRLIAVDSDFLEAQVQEVARDIDHYLMDGTQTVKALSVADVVLNGLHSSNQEFAELGEEQRKERIDHLNAKWIATLDEKDPFIKSYTSNAAARYLIRVAATSPDEFGEIFMTNRYGVIVSTTNKLTTLAHTHKYWWKAAYDDGKGRVFLDDRGFDQSVQGYAIGVVVPIKEGDEVIGILKANLNLISGLSEALWGGPQQGYGELSLVRSGGLIVLSKDTRPLSTTLPSEVIKDINPLVAGSREIALTGGPSSGEGHYLVAHAPVSLSLGEETIGFGGKYRSMDQYKGNKGESWMVVTKKDMTEVIEPFNGELMQLLLSGAALLLIFVLLAVWVSSKALQSGSERVEAARNRSGHT